MEKGDRKDVGEKIFQSVFFKFFGGILLVGVIGPVIAIILLVMAKSSLNTQDPQLALSYLQGAIIFLSVFLAIVIISKTASGYLLVKKIRSFASQLRESLGELEAVLEDAVLPIISIDEEGTVMSFNKSAEDFFGYKKEEVIGNNITMIQPEEVARRHDNYLKNYITTGKKTIIGTGREVVAQHKNGNALPIYLSVSEAKINKDGKSLFVGMITDMGELKKNEQKMNAIIDAAVDSIITIDSQGIVQSFNKGAEAMFGYQADEIIGNNIKLLQPEEVAAKHDQYLLNYIKTGKANIIGMGRELVAKHKDGSDIPIHLSVSEVQLGKSEEPLFVGIARDISDANIKQGVNEYTGLIEKISKGDLRERIDVDKYKGDLSILGDYLNSMTNNLAKIAREIISASGKIVTGLSEIDEAIGTQASSATEQEAAVKETTAVMDQIKASSKETLKKAQVLGKSAERTHEEARRGLESVEQSSSSMGSIKEKMSGIAKSIVNLSNKMKQIGETTSLVNGLAQQSKLLALNASIEAAKAGEAGKGFAVVAAEVKDLAEQSHQATVQVQGILDNIQQATDKAVMVTEEGSKEVDSGVDSISKTGEVIENLNNVIKETTVASQQIVEAVDQEAKGVEEVSKAMLEINKSIGYLVSSVEKTKAISKQLADVVNSLQSNANIYKLEAGEAEGIGVPGDKDDGSDISGGETIGS
jgi:PAS domain S-box-containing protein